MTTVTAELDADTVYAELRDAVVIVCEVPPETLSRSTRLEADLQADSLALVEIIDITEAALIPLARAGFHFGRWPARRPHHASATWSTTRWSRTVAVDQAAAERAAAEQAATASPHRRSLPATLAASLGETLSDEAFTAAMTHRKLCV